MAASVTMVFSVFAPGTSTLARLRDDPLIAFVRLPRVDGAVRFALEAP